MKNQEVAKLLNEIADLLEIKGEMVFKIRAYRRAAQSVESLSRSIEEIAKENKLDEIPGIGRGIAEKIEEFLEKGNVKYVDGLRKGLPEGISQLLELEGIGPKKVKLFYDKLRIKNLAELKKAAEAGKLRKIHGFGAKTEENILKSIENSKKRGGRMLLGYATLLADEIIAEMKKNKHIDRISVAGSLRRMKETIGDIDILVTSSNPKSVIDSFTKMSSVGRVLAVGPTKASVNLHSGMQADLRVLPDSEYGSALMYFTGSKEHNVELRKIAISRKLKLSEYGLFSGRKSVAGKTEEEVYGKLGLRYIEPELRENRGEIDAARKGKLPHLIGYGDMKGDLHMHSKWSDGRNTIEEMALAAKERGYEYICITDHAGNLAITNALDGKRLDKQRKEIDAASKKVGIPVLQGAEIDIRNDGKFDVDNSILKKLDIVLASLHSGLNQTREKNTERILKAMENPHVDIIAHLSGRLLENRSGADLDIEKIVRKAKETNTVLEVDAQPPRLDMSDVNVKAAVEAGARLSIDTDAHSKDQLNFMRAGIGTARRGWAKKEDVINTRPLEKMRKCLK